MTRKDKIKIIMICMLAFCNAQGWAQDYEQSRKDIEVTNFRRAIRQEKTVDNYKDNNGRTSALVNFYVNRSLKGVSIKGNMGNMGVNRTEQDGKNCLKLYVPDGTRKFTIECKNHMTLSNYEIDVPVMSGYTYEANVDISDIKILDFKSTTSSDASYYPKKDKLGNYCGLVKFYMRNPKDLVIQTRTETIKTSKDGSTVKAYLPKGTESFTLKCENLEPLYYSLPEPIQSKVTYEALLETVSTLSDEQRIVYVGAGFNVTSITGPSLAVGASFNRHNVEIGGILGMNKSDERFFYTSNGSLISGHTYKAFRAYARYGYEFPLTSFLDLVPQAGLAPNFINGSDIEDIVGTDNDYMKSASSVSALLAARFVASLNNHFKVQITPEYDFALSKNDKCKTLNSLDSTIKSWTEGFSLNVGVMVYF